MYLEIDGKNYIIHLNSNNQHIRIQRIVDDVVHLIVPIEMPQEYLLTYVKTELKKDISRFKRNKGTNVANSLTIFDKNYNIRITDTKYPFIKNEILHLNQNILSSKKEIKLAKEQILLNQINSTYSTIEEDINLMLPNINLKKFKTKFYSICHKSNHIIYCKTLLEKPLDFINYIVILSIGSYLNYSIEEIKLFGKRYVLDLKHCERICNYERKGIKNRN